MKNIHILPTDKPSRVRIGNNGNFVIGLAQNATVSKNDSYTNQNIYITSDEEIKKWDWCYQVELNDGKVDKCYDVTLYHTWTNNGVDKTRKFKKIILTTDQDLIKDGVQAIDNEFLEWFVKNPSCEEVEIKSWIKTYEDGSSFDRIDYEIIIPKEEPKPHSFCETPEEKCTMNYCDENGCQNRKRELVEPKQKQETLEEFIQRQLSLGKYQDQESAIRNSIELTAKWQQERMYNEEEVLNFTQTIIQQYKLGNTNIEQLDLLKETLQQFKNK